MNRRFLAAMAIFASLASPASGQGTVVYDASFSGSNSTPNATPGSTTGMGEVISIGAANSLGDTAGGSWQTYNGYLATPSQTGSGNSIGRSSDLQFLGTLSGTDYSLTIVPGGVGVLTTLCVRRQSNGDRYELVMGTGGGYVTVNKVSGGAYLPVNVATSQYYAQNSPLGTPASYNVQGSCTFDSTQWDAGTTVTLAVSGTSTVYLSVQIRTSTGKLLLATTFVDATSPLSAAGRPAVYRYPQAWTGTPLQILKRIIVSDLSAASVGVVNATLQVASSSPSGNVFTLKAAGGSGALAATLYRCVEPDFPISTTTGPYPWTSVATGTVSGGVLTLTDSAVPAVGQVYGYRAVVLDSSSPTALACTTNSCTLSQSTQPIAIVAIGDSIDNSQTGILIDLPQSNVPVSGGSNLAAGYYGLTPAAPTVSLTGGGSTGGLISATALSARVCFTLGGCESQPLPAVAFTPASGNIPRLTITSIPAPYTAWNLYVGASGSEYIYKTGMTGTYVDLDVATAPAPAAPTGTATGGGSTGGSLAAGTIGVAYVYRNSTTGVCSPASNYLALTVAAGNIPQPVVPAIPAPYNVFDLYVGYGGNASQLLGLYASGLTTLTQNLSAAVPTFGASSPAAPRGTFGTGTTANTMRGNWTNFQAANGYQSYVECQNLSAMFGDKPITFYDVAQAGDSMTSFVPGAVSGGAGQQGPNFAIMATAVDAAIAQVGAANVILTVKLGTNDVQAISATAFNAEVANLNAIIAWAVTTKGVGKVVLHEPPWNVGWQRTAWLEAYRSQLTSLCDNVHVFRGDSTAVRQTANGANFLYDGTHPNLIGVQARGASRALATYKAISGLGGGTTANRPRRPIYFVAPPRLGPAIRDDDRKRSPILRRKAA